MSQLYILYEHAVGYGLFLVTEFEDIGAFLPQVEAAANDPVKFAKVVKLTAFKPFKNTVAALSNMNSISEGLITEDLTAFLETNLPKPGKKNKIVLGVTEPKLGASINETMKIQVNHIGIVPEILRGIRTHITHFIKGLNAASLKQTELGLGHSYSRSKVKFNVHRVDNMIIQSIALVDQLDKDINTFSMRIREWYSYHFPELARVVTDNYQYAVCAHYIKNRTSLSEESLEKLEEITMDSTKARAILDAAKMSMGMDISAVDLLNIEIFAKRVASLAQYRKGLAEYLSSKMNSVAPNLAALIGDTVGARLISHAGSLTNLAKYPASTVQILGAEKALFRAIKTKGKTPKYGLIFHSSFISKAAQSNKGRISRYLANKCSIASRIDCFSENLTSVFGMKLRGQVEERLNFYQSGDLPRKNVDVMTEASTENEVVVRKMERKSNDTADLDISQNGEVDSNSTKKKKKKKKSKCFDMDVNGELLNSTSDGSAKKRKSKAIEDEVTSPKKKKKKDLNTSSTNGDDGKKKKGSKVKDV